MSVLGFVALGLYAAILVTKLVLVRRYMAVYREGIESAVARTVAHGFSRGEDVPIKFPSPLQRATDKNRRAVLSPAEAGLEEIRENRFPTAEAVGYGSSPITILQPILSGDPALGETLQCNLEQLDARFLWLVDDDDAEGQRVTEELAASNGQVSILRCPPVSAHANPKTVKLQRGLAAVETTYVAVLDDDTIVTQEHLQRALAELESCTLYTGLPCYLPGANFWSSLVTCFVNNNSALTYLPLLPLIGPLTINGMFYVMRSEELRAMGGFAPIEEKLCDDYALATLVKRHGGTIRQGVTRQYLRTTVTSAAHYVRLMHRWFLFANTLVRDQPFGVQLLLFFALGLPPLLFWSGFATLSYALPVVLVLRYLVIREVQREHVPPDASIPTPERRHPAGWRGGILPPSDVAAAGSRRSSRLEGGAPVKDAALSTLSELLQPLHWLHATLWHTLRWRTRRIRLGPDGTFSYLERAAS